MMIEGLSFIFDNFFDVFLFFVVDLYFFDAVVSSKIVLEVMSEEIDEFFHLFSIVLQVTQYLWNEIIQLGLYFLC